MCVVLWCGVGVCMCTLGVDCVHCVYDVSVFDRHMLIAEIYTHSLMALFID